MCLLKITHRFKPSIITFCLSGFVALWSACRPLSDDPSSNPDEDEQWGCFRMIKRRDENKLTEEAEVGSVCSSFVFLHE